jgi:hypothetical protein
MTSTRNAVEAEQVTRKMKRHDLFATIGRGDDGFPRTGAQKIKTVLRITLAIQRRVAPVGNSAACVRRALFHFVLCAADTAIRPITITA